MNGTQRKVVEMISKENSFLPGEKRDEMRSLVSPKEELQVRG